MYKVTIGLEVHCELKSISKVFSRGKNSYSESANIYVNEVDLGLPGVLPTLNKEAVRKSILLSLALNCEIPSYLSFDRKNYFYPDLPKGYQITQNKMPIGTNGRFPIFVSEEEKEILIHDIHLEEDTASIDHYLNFSLIDYNRCGNPLIEIVTEPCMHSKEEALAFLDYLRRMFLYLDASEARIDKGQIRCDVNISLSKSDDLGTRVEIKNVNSFNGVKEAIEYEIERQTNLLEKNEPVLQETRRYDDSTKTTIAMRSKEDAIDYRYFPEPNIPKIKINTSFIEEVKKCLIPLQYDRIKKYLNLNISLKDATFIAKDKDISNYFEKCINNNSNIKTIVNLINNDISSYLNKNDISINEIYLKPEMLISLIDLVDNNKITSKQAKEVLNKSLEEKIDPIEIVKHLNIRKNDNREELTKMAKDIIKENEHMVLKYKEGRNVLDFFIGQVMKKTKGSANPSLTSEIFKDELDKL